MKGGERKGVAFNVYERFGTTEGSIGQKVLRTSADREFWNEHLPELTRSFVGSVRILSDKKVTSFKSFVLVTSLVHMLLFNLRKEYVKSPVQSRHSLMEFSPAETEQVKNKRGADIGDVENQYMVIPRAMYWMVKKRYM